MRNAVSRCPNDGHPHKLRSSRGYFADAKLVLYARAKKFPVGAYTRRRPVLEVTQPACLNFIFGSLVEVRRPTGTSSIVFGHPSSPVTTYSGYAGKPCSWISSPSISPSVGMRRRKLFSTAYIRPSDTTRVAAVMEKL